ncbi:SDR family NAD(P)-dependent oxidoreductase [Chloroflexota bacterium]
MSTNIFSIEGKVIIVTGAGRGIGNALAPGFADAGAPVALVARTVSDLEKTAQEIRDRGARP